MGKRNESGASAVLFSGLPDVSYEKKRKTQTDESRMQRIMIRDQRLTMIAAGFIFCLGVLFFVQSEKSHTRMVPQTISAGREETAALEKRSSPTVPSGFSGLFKGLNLGTGSRQSSRNVRRIGTHAEKLLVGQRIRRVSPSGSRPIIDLSGFLDFQVSTLHDAASDIPRNALMMSDYDYEALLRIVEAEAGTEDLKGRLLVANVIMNRVKDKRFPDSVSEVIYSYDSGVAQFSPVDDGTLYEVIVSAGTREAVRNALEGKDVSQGALFFVQKDAADPENVLWFEGNLKFLFRHGVHDFYTYP